jgi:hypothetical protein
MGGSRTVGWLSLCSLAEKLFRDFENLAEYSSIIALSLVARLNAFQTPKWPG